MVSPILTGACRLKEGGGGEEGKGKDYLKQQQQ